MLNEKNIIIIGGGTAGWLTAISIAKFLKNINCTIIDSSTIGTIGVGEGTTGLFLEYINSLGIDFNDFFLSTNAMPKYGIKFTDWTNEKSSFISPIDGSCFGNDGLDVLFFGSLLKKCNVNYTSSCATLIEEQKTDILFENGSMKSIFGNIALHLDTFKTIEYFKNFALKNFKNIKHIDKTILDFEMSKDGNLSNVVFCDESKCHGDFFIDCSGFSKIAIKKLNPNWIDYSKSLTLNTAIPFKLKNDTFKKELYTTARALKNGWLWEIPTKNRIGRGYIYDSNFTNEEKVISELESIFETDVEKIKTIKFSSGRLEKFWIKNCVAVGLSAAFLEPLQATSIHCAIVQIDDLIKNCLNCPLETILLEENIKNYNERISILYSNMANFVSMHYSGGRNDTEYWKHITNDVRCLEGAENIIQKAKCRLTRSQDFNIHAGFAGMHMWNYSLNGLGHFHNETLEQILSNINFDFSKLPIMIENFKNNIRSLVSNTLTLEEIEKINEK